MSRYICRVIGFDLTPGNKSAGFVLSVDTVALNELAHAPVSEKVQDDVVLQARMRAERARLGSKLMRSGMGIWFLEDTLVPRVFSSHSCFGGSVGADPETFSRLKSADFLQMIGSDTEYTPHNVDAPVDAMLQMMLVQTWSEWATALLSSRSQLVKQELM